MPSTNSQRSRVLTGRQPSYWLATYRTHIRLQIGPLGAFLLGKSRALSHSSTPPSTTSVTSSKTGPSSLAKVSHSKGIKFGKIDLTKRGKKSKRLMTITATSLENGVSLTAVHVSSSCLKISPSQYPSNIKLGKQRQISLVFDSGRASSGVFSGEMKLEFLNRITETSFVVTRPISAEVSQPPPNEVKGNPQVTKRTPTAKRKASERNARELRVDSAQNFIPGPSWVSQPGNHFVYELGEYPLQASFQLKGNENERLEGIRRLLPNVMSKKTYGRFWSSLIDVEEHQSVEGLETYDLFAVPLKKGKDNLYLRETSLRIPGLAEKRPSVILGDAVHLKSRLSFKSHPWYEGRVVRVLDGEVALRFCDSFPYQREELWDVQFKPSRFRIRRMHEAVQRTPPVPHILFPKSSYTLGHPPPTEQDITDLTPHLRNRLVALNPPQLRAVAAIVNRPPGSVPFVIDGPPGTGKTITVVEAIRQLLKREETRILICTPSNSAANLITTRLADLDPSELFRLCASSVPERALPEDVLPFTCRVDNGFFMPSREVVASYRVVVSTCSAAVLHAIGMEAGHFSHIFIDEAGQGMEPEVVIPINGMSNERTNVILSGDPQQLGPILQSKVASQLGLGTSLLERLLERDVYQGETADGVTKVQLTKNWRSHPAILVFPNAAFYDQRLEPCADPKVVNSLIGSPVLPKPSFPVVFHGVEGQDQRDDKSPSYYNLKEVSVVVKYIDRLFRDKRHPLTVDDIGIISPYIAQTRKLRQQLNRYQGLKIGSVEEFQGQASRSIILGFYDP
ncbi:hypothetical protein FRB99_008585 [Tulasnella sp. 403]|nr:hypothetical protein FRB99_008585 [Tulasnella sp. 403]